MAKDLVPGEPDNRRVEDVPLATQRASDALVKRFSGMLQAQAIGYMKRRGSNTPTDADLDDAFRHLTRPSKTSLLQKFIGDGLLILGGTFIPLATESWLLTMGGIVMCCVGLYVREYLSEK